MHGITVPLGAPSFLCEMQRGWPAAQGSCQAAARLYRRASMGCSCAVVQRAPPSADTSTRMMGCPPPLYAYPVTCDSCTHVGTWTADAAWHSLRCPARRRRAAVPQCGRWGCLKPTERIPVARRESMPAQNTKATSFLEMLYHACTPKRVRCWHCHLQARRSMHVRAPGDCAMRACAGLGPVTTQGRPALRARLDSAQWPPDGISAGRGFADGGVHRGVPRWSPSHTSRGFLHSNNSELPAGLQATTARRPHAGAPRSRPGAPPPRCPARARRWRSAHWSPAPRARWTNPRCPSPRWARSSCSPSARRRAEWGSGPEACHGGQHMGSSASDLELC